ncbi:MAG: 2-octaprenyl-3-methyl-6-methoxy-1,4-benzoquinol hydroxylase [Citrobacter freundii]|nr:2-octaprenyl-3-methyl-6-methoxy-1,4-benzoquinol hydroxylase [Citrobacter freundii]
MTNQPTEIAIVGGGMVGGALALGLAQHGFSVTVIEHAAPAPFVAGGQPDVRISAISSASVSLLKGLGVWDTVQGMRSHPYRRLETWEWENAHVMFDAAELKLPLLGYMVENTVLQQALWQALEVHPKVTLRVPASLLSLHQHHDRHELELADGEKISAKLVIGADGANSQVRKMAGIGIHAWQYAQSCMLITVQCEHSPGDSTWQQFTPDGPRAFLPLFDNWASLVWYDSPARIRQLQALNMPQLQAEIAKHFPSRLGNVTPVAAGAFPLTRRHALQYVQPGYGESWASQPVLKRYQNRRMTDNFIMQSGMDLFYAGFSNNLQPLRIMRNLGLMAAERAGVLKRQALKYALGL